jgi:hypothetical protein
MAATMIKKVKLTEIQRWNGTTSSWVSLYGKSGASAEEIITEVTGYEDTTGVASSSPLPITINWASFKSKVTVGYTIFGSTGNLLATTLKSIKIRYKIETTSSEVSNPVQTTPNYFYQIIKLSFPDTGGVSGISTTPTGTYTASIKVRVPALILAALPSGQSVAGVHAYLAAAANWRIDYLAPNAGSLASLTPSNASIGADGTASGDANYGGHYIEVTLTCQITLSTSGAFAIDIYFNPNDGGNWSAVCATIYGTATVQAHVGSQSAPIIYSVDESTTISITFTSSAVN